VSLALSSTTFLCFDIVIDFCYIFICDNNRIEYNYQFIAQEFRGKTLEIFGVQSANIVDVFTFEPVEIRIKTGRLDLIFRNESGAYFLIEG